MASTKPGAVHCDELRNVIAMNYFFYDAVEALTVDEENSMNHPLSHDGLALWARHLRQRGQDIRGQLDDIHLAAKE